MFLSPECHLVPWFIYSEYAEHRQQPAKLKYWEPNTTAATTISCPKAARELRVNLVIHKHKHTHAPTIPSPSPHMGLKTIGLTPALPRLLPLRLTAPESALTVLPRVTTQPGQMKQNQWAPRLFKRAQSWSGKRSTPARRKSLESRQENGSALLLMFHLVNPRVLLECKVEIKARLCRNQSSSGSSVSMHQDLKHWQKCGVKAGRFWGGTQIALSRPLGHGYNQKEQH